jgi:hypothetical protein
MDIVVAIIGLAMLVAAVAYIAQPLVAKSRALSPLESPREKLLSERDALYVSIRDWDFDFQTGKLLETDYRAMREKYVARGVEILKQLDAMPDVRKSKAGGRKSEVADDVEAAVQARRKARSSEDEIEVAVRARRQPSIRDSLTPQKTAGPAREIPQSEIRNLNCPQCGRPIDPADRFCGKCGVALTVEADH